MSIVAKVLPAVLRFVVRASVKALTSEVNGSEAKRKAIQKKHDAKEAKLHTKIEELRKQREAIRSARTEEVFANTRKTQQAQDMLDKLSKLA